MKAIVQNHYGSPGLLELKEVDKPQVKEDQVLVRVHAAALNAGDYFSMQGSPWLARFSVGFPRPRDYILGWDLAGQVEEVGKNVKGFKPGDEVFGSCSHTLAEYVCAAEGHLAPKPATLTFEQAAAVPTAALTALQGLRDAGKIQPGHKVLINGASGGVSNLTFEQAAAVPTAALTALQGLRDAGKTQPGQKVLINGASGGVGTFAVQIAKALGAEVTAVCSTNKVDQIRSLGADHVVDYTKDDFTQKGQRYDLVLDNVGNRSFSDFRRVLTPTGKLIPNTGHAGMGYVVLSLVRSLFLRQQGGLFMATPNRDDLVTLKDLIEAGKVTPVIDRTYTLAETPAALQYVGDGHARGKVVILM